MFIITINSTQKSTDIIGAKLIAENIGNAKIIKE